jgi:glucoamylase
MMNSTIKFLFVCVLAATVCSGVGAQSRAVLAPGAPGAQAQWTDAGKDAVGTANTIESKVWFTLHGGVMTEVYYPTVDVANTRALELVVVSGTRVETESADTTHRVELLDEQALTFRQTNAAKSGLYTITKTYTVDPERHTVLIEVGFESRARLPLALYVYYDPSLNNSGMHDSAWSQGGALLASDADKASALVSSAGFAETTNGYFETSDGLTQLRRGGRITAAYARAADGNVVQVARLVPAAHFTLALAFGREPDEALRNARASLQKGFARARAEYESGWREYVRTLRSVAPQYRRQFDAAAMVLKSHEDKTYRGAMIASLTIPWGGGADANEPNVGGYHLVWSRDLYQVATAFYALGDKSSADRALDYLLRVQQKPDGSFPQNSWLDGRPFWGSLQLDEVAYPLILAYQLGRTDNETWAKHVRPAANFLVRTGPRTPQERWEEKSGYSPSTIAAEISGLVCAAEIARRNGDEASSAIYLAAADDWARNVERWTATSTGKYGDGNYYLRLTDNDDPNDGAIFNVGNGGGDYDEREIVDAGFLELVRLGVRRADDPLIAKSLPVIDGIIKIATPNGEDWYRYNHDGYGELDDGRLWNWNGKYEGKGRPWPLLAGERGEYELARGEKERAARRLDALMAFANEGLMIPEQVWDLPQSPQPRLRFGEGTGSATPLAWAMAQFVRLATNLEAGRNLETPDLVAARYSAHPVPPETDDSFLSPDDEALSHLEAGSSLRFTWRVAPGTRAFILEGAGAREVAVGADGGVDLSVKVPEGESVVAFVAQTPGGASIFHRLKVRGLSPEEWRAWNARAVPLAVAEKLKAARRSPIIEGDEVTFVYRGSARQVEVVGDFTGWTPRRLSMQEVPGTDLKFYTRRFAKEARLEYKFIADSEWVNDALNPDRIDNGVGGFNSFFAMPGYRATVPLALPPKHDGATHEEIEVRSARLGGQRRIQVYLPPGYRQSQDRYPVLYVQDGSEYVGRARAVEVADDLINSGRVAAFIIVFVDPQDRMKDYWASDDFAAFMATELVPFVDARYRTRTERDGRALLGASLGGVISLWTALKYPDVFARVGAQSTAFQINDEKVVTALTSLGLMSVARPTSFYFDVGRFEPVLGESRRVRVLLAARGYPVTYRETEAGHNWTNWRDQLPEAFTAIWSPLRTRA